MRLSALISLALFVCVSSTSLLASNDDCTGSTCSTKEIKTWWEEGAFHVEYVCEGSCPNVARCADGSGCTERTLDGNTYCRCNTSTRPYGNIDDCILYTQTGPTGVVVKCQKKTSCTSSCPLASVANGQGQFVSTCNCL